MQGRQPTAVVDWYLLTVVIERFRVGGNATDPINVVTDLPPEEWLRQMIELHRSGKVLGLEDVTLLWATPIDAKTATALRPVLDRWDPRTLVTDLEQEGDHE